MPIPCLMSWSCPCGFRVASRVVARSLAPPRACSGGLSACHGVVVMFLLCCTGDEVPVVTNVIYWKRKKDEPFQGMSTMVPIPRFRCCASRLLCVMSRGSYIAFGGCRAHCGDVGSSHGGVAPCCIRVCCEVCLSAIQQKIDR